MLLFFNQLFYIELTLFIYVVLINFGNNILLDPERKMLVEKSRKAGLNRAVARFRGGWRFWF